MKLLDLNSLLSSLLEATVQGSISLYLRDTPQSHVTELLSVEYSRCQGLTRKKNAKTRDSISDLHASILILSIKTVQVQD